MAIVATHADERDGGTLVLWLACGPEDKRTAVFFSPRERPARR
jgi:hypothetical protein